jgi:hypothetical protein
MLFIRYWNSPLIRQLLDDFIRAARDVATGREVHDLSDERRVKGR